MTRRQVIAKMKKAGIEGTVTGAGKLWEVELTTDRLMRKFQKLVTSVGGYMTGYGAWILSPGYVSKGDWNDKASAWHY